MVRLPKQWTKAYLVHIAVAVASQSHPVPLWCLYWLSKYDPLAKSSPSFGSFGFVWPMSQEWFLQMSIYNWLGGALLWRLMKQNVIPQNNSMFSIADLYYKTLYQSLYFEFVKKFVFFSLLKYLYDILDFTLQAEKLKILCFTEKFCWSLCRLSLKIWKVKDEGWEVCKDSRNRLTLGWWQYQSRAGSKEVWGRPGTPRPGVLLKVLDPPWCLSEGCCSHRLASLNWVYINCAYPVLQVLFIYILFFKDFLFFRKRERGEKYHCVFDSCMPPTGICPATQTCALTGNRIHDPLVHRLVLNPLSHTSQGCISSFTGLYS